MVQAELTGAVPEARRDLAMPHGGRGDISGDARDIARAVRQPLLLLSDDLTVEVANPAFCAAFRVQPGQSEGRKIYAIGNGQWDLPAVRDLLEGKLVTDGEVDDLRIEHTFAQGLGHRVLLLSACRVPLANGGRRILLTVEDVTEAE